MQRLSLITLLLCLGLQARAQVVFQDTLYVNADNRIITDSLAAEAHSYIVRKLDKDSQFHGDIVRYYANGQVYEQYSFVHGKRENEFALYSESGQPLLKGTYKDDRKTGKETKWFDNGQKHYEAEYVGFSKVPQQRIINEWDEEGKQLIKDGKGWVTRDDADRDFFEEGQYEDGFKQGEWLGTYKESGQRYFVESYERGEMVGGTSFDQEGQSYDYRTISSLATFKGGMKAWAEYVQDEMKYPKKLARKRITAEVRVSFVIDTDGSLTDIAVLQPTLPEFDNEALRLLRQSPRWQPAVERGQKVKSRLRTAIQFQSPYRLFDNNALPYIR